MSWVVYILECGDGSLYTGITNDLDARVAAHEGGIGAKYTKGRGPFRVMHTESFESRGAASKREISIKKLKKLEKIALWA